MLVGAKSFIKPELKNQGLK